MRKLLASILAAFLVLPVYAADESPKGTQGNTQGNNGPIVWTLMGLSNDGATTLIGLRVDPTTKELLVKATTSPAGSATVVGAAADGAAVSGNPVRMGIKDNGGLTQDAVGSSAGVPSSMQALTFTDAQSNTGGMSIDEAAFRGLAGRAIFNFNGTNWDRYRGNQDLTVLASAARTGDTNSTDFVNYNGGGAWFVLNITAVPGVSTVNVIIEGKDVLSAAPVTLLTGAIQVGTGTTEYVVYPGVTETANVDVSRPLPRTFRVTVDHIGAGSFTYSVGASVIQ